VENSSGSRVNDWKTNLRIRGDNMALELGNGLVMGRHGRPVLDTSKKTGLRGTCKGPKSKTTSYKDLYGQSSVAVSPATSAYMQKLQEVISKM